jgi:hypothetical protein
MTNIWAQSKRGSAGCDGSYSRLIPFRRHDDIYRVHILQTNVVSLTVNRSQNVLKLPAFGMRVICKNH